MDYKLTLFDRIEVIKTVNKKYDLEHNAYLSFSGGKDSTILHYLLDEALPNNRIPRVFINTGIEYQAIVEFVKGLAEKDDRFVLLKPSVAVKPMLEKYGYPFKSKQHAHNIALYQTHNKEKFEEIKKVIKDNPQLLKSYDFIHELPLGIKTLVKYYYGVRERERESCMSIMTIPKKLEYQLTPQCNLKISDSCCREMKKKPIHKWEKENNRFIAITGMRNEEGGNRQRLGCIITDSRTKKVVKFHPLIKVDEQWENEFITNNDIKLCKLYYPPFNFVRTGCKGCPFALTLAEQLETMAKYLPNERKQCEVIWKPVYEEYRRLNYRLTNQMSIFDFMEENKNEK